MRDRDVRVRKWLIVAFALVEAVVLGFVILRARG